MQTTIIYYTSSREEEGFEKKIRDNILKQTDIPIISVSQKPIDFGKNICVGDRGLSYVNARRQILIGAEQATTEYLTMCESDFLYPKEYFDFIPKGENLYKYDNVWIVWKDLDNKARKKISSEGAIIVKRDYFIKELKLFLDKYPEWTNDYIKAPPFNNYVYIKGNIPCISFKTGDGVRKNTNYIRDHEKLRELPYWGNVKELKKYYL